MVLSTEVSLPTAEVMESTEMTEPPELSLSPEAIVSLEVLPERTLIRNKLTAVSSEMAMSPTVSLVMSPEVPLAI